MTAADTGVLDQSAARTDLPLVSIIINNHNYGRFLRDAIESALSQQYSRTEVIVVDDGSTDDSREIIASYGERIVPILKEKGGQASAFNAGFARSRGDMVVFLDSDDMLLPHVIEMVVGEFQQNARLAKVQYRLEVIDREGRPTGYHQPPASLAMPNGDLRKHTLTFPDDIRSSPTTGNAFAAWALRQILPIPEDAYGPDGADLYLHNLAPLFGPVKSLPSPGARYRVHGSNYHYRAQLSADAARRIITRSAINHQYIVKYAQILNLPGTPQDSSDILSVTYLANRMASLKLDPQHHPVTGDSVVGLMWLGIQAASRRFDLPHRTRLAFMLWFIAAALSPKAVTRWLVTRAFHADHRGLLGRWIRT